MLVSLITLIYLFHCSVMKVPKELTFRCKSSYDRTLDRSKLGFDFPAANMHVSNARLRLDAKVLVFVETQYSHLGRQIQEILEASRIKWVYLLTYALKKNFLLITWRNLIKHKRTLLLMDVHFSEKGSKLWKSRNPFLIEI